MCRNSLDDLTQKQPVACHQNLEENEKAERDLELGPYQTYSMAI